jgi:CHRD domain
VAAIRNGVAYVNVHSAKYPAGEIRGQIRRGWGGSDD